MNSVILFNYLLPYGMPTVLIATAVAIISSLLYKFLPKKIAVIIKGYFPFVLGIILYFLYDGIFISRKLNFSGEIISAGLLCGTLGAIIFAFTKNLKSGNVCSDPILLAIEELLSERVNSSDLPVASKRIKEIISENYFNEELVFIIAEELLLLNASEDVFSLLPLSSLLIEAVKSLENPQNGLNLNK